jgi:anti-anti-sigma factor
LEDFEKECVQDIVVQKVNLLKATQIEAQPFWQRLESNNVFDSTKIIVDLSFCTFVDSTFKGIIVKAFRKITENKGKLKLVLPQLEAVDSFKLSGLTQTIDSFEDLESAIKSYNVKLPINKLKLNFANKNFESSLA